ncbi:hypothetical protein [Motilibacter peucedani]|uniref:hypothetical protein n=1 Tax=Motilibacter peucedani TaxID=598650 RepID=UPI001E42DB1A|nr:hypothetical protein [Motilibacter peucedani]
METRRADTIQIAGSLVLLAALLAALTGRLEQSSYAYLAANALGSGVLAGSAVFSQE